MEKFSQNLPIIGYDAISDLVKKEMAGEPRQLSNHVLRYQPTSGSTSERKWIPYSAGYLKELQNAISPWLADAYHRHPGLRKGRHYWSLSWLPNDLRRHVETTDDTSLLPFVKRLLQRQFMAVPESAQHAETAEAAMFATVCWLAATQNLTLISVWSPTFALGILRRLREMRTEISAVLVNGDWGNRSAILSQVRCPKNPVVASMLAIWDGSQQEVFYRELWPNLCLLSCWTTGTSASYTRDLKELVPHAVIEGKGLWATEGVVTIPFKQSFPLAVNSHFLEFRCLTTDRILPAWELMDGQVVQPIISTSSGLLRYELSDELIVSGRIGHCPTLEFRGRIGGIDFVGEKIDAKTVAAILCDLGNSDDRTYNGVQGRQAIVGVQAAPLPYYVLVKEGRSRDRPDLDRDNFLEKKMLSFHHYRLARDLNQLAPARAAVCGNLATFLAAIGRQRGMIEGDIKAEMMVRCPTEAMFDIALKESA